MADRRIILPIKGMECGACAATVQRRLAGAKGVREAHVNFTTGLATVSVTDGGTQAADLIKVVREVGFDSAGATVKFDVVDFRHTSAMERLERELTNQPGVLSASANQATEQIEVEYLAGVVTVRDIEQAIAAVGFSLAEPPRESDPIHGDWMRYAERTQGLAWRLGLSITATVIALVASIPLLGESTVKSGDLVARLLSSLDPTLRGVLPQLFQMNPLWIQLGLALLALGIMLHNGKNIYAVAWQRFRYRSADANTLVAVATSVVFLYSIVAIIVRAAAPNSNFPPDVYFESVTGIIAFVLLGRLLEARGNARAAQAVHGLLALQPRTAQVRRNDALQEVAAHQISVGDRVAVSPGESIPVDGMIVAGDSDIDLSMFGEAPSVRVGPGSRVPAGAVNRTAPVEVEAATTARKTTLGQTVQIIEDAQFKKGPTQQRVDRLVGQLTPVVIALAIVAVVLWALLDQVAPSAFAMLAFVTVLAVAAPSAVSFSIPCAIKAGIGRGAELGAVFRGGAVIDTIRRVDTVVFGKTGTITEGTPTVTHVVGAKRADNTTVSPAEILQVAGAVESRSQHPLASAILASAKEKGIDLPGVERFVEMHGRGVRGIVGRFLVEVISVRHARERSLELGRLTKDIDRHVLSGRTPVVVVVNDVVRGLIIVADPTKPNAKDVITQLGALGYTLFMLSGDSKSTARLIAKENGIDRVVAEVEPGNKADEIKRLQEDGRVVAVIADGIDDASVLAQADVGIALGVGHEIAMQASEVTLPSHDLQGVVNAFQLARRTASTIRTNLIFAFLYNLVGIPLAAGVLYPMTGLLLTPMLAAAAGGVATWIVIANSLRLAKFNPTSAT
ncbi:MAG: heavy metal translocating P-type ATPase [Gemmatimonadetes bacterium]|nr:heavy metal translocating P-type ATPase [Gemmatimonadota bacterium]